MDRQRLLEWALVGTSLVAGLLVAIRDPGRGLFEQSMRTLGLTGPVLQPLAMFWTALWVFAALVVVYVLGWLLVRRILGLP